MNLANRLKKLESQIAPTGIVLLTKSGAERFSPENVLTVYQALRAENERWHELGLPFPLPEDEIRAIPLLPELLESIGVESDVPAKYPRLPVAPIIESIRLLVERAPRELQRDETGDYILQPSLCGPIRRTFVEPKHESLAA